MYFSPLEDEKLVEFVSKYPVLYDASVADYKDAVMRENIWKEIGLKLNKTGMLAKLDESVGKIVEAMAERGILDNSIIVFLSDNGAQTFGLHTNEGSNWPLRGLKFTLFEGGVRGTCAIWSPLIKQTGRVSSDLIHISDWLPTLYSAAGGNVSDLGDVDGVDQWPNLASIPGDSPRSELLLNIDSSRGMEALISDEWKLVVGSFEDGVYDYHYGDDGRETKNQVYITEVLQSPVSRCIAVVSNSSSVIEEADIERLRSLARVECRGVIVNGSGPYCNSPCLFKLTDDPCETNDVSSVYPELVERMKKTLDRHREKMVPQLNQPVDPASDPALFDDVWVPWLDFSAKSCGIQGGTFLVSFVLLWMVTRSFLV
uniref:Sulfatase N-terminal domain-containing protein n=1 Tax=Timema monikensis TaxID=170555 RepID=A0A7R9HPC9_9NEOP|nr:unnamed protein product [Timema monikensis]